MQDFLKRILFGFIFIGMLVSIAAAVKCTLPRYQAWCESRQLRQTLQGEVAGKQREIAEIKRKIERFRSSRWFVEQLARENHRVAENEIVVLFD